MGRALDLAGRKSQVHILPQMLPRSRQKENEHLVSNDTRVICVSSRKADKDQMPPAELPLGLASLGLRGPFVCLSLSATP